MNVMNLITESYKSSINVDSNTKQSQIDSIQNHDNFE